VLKNIVIVYILPHQLKSDRSHHLMPHIVGEREVKISKINISRKVWCPQHRTNTQHTRKRV